jgi:prenyltransferase beta subunit
MVVHFHICILILFFLLNFEDALLQDPCHNGSHLASTYSALAILKIVGYDLANIDSKALLLSMKKLQQPDGR